VKTAYTDGELCGVDEAGLPSFAQTQAATDGERDVHLVYYAFDLLHLGRWDISGLGLIERKASASISRAIVSINARPLALA
jgi:ATP-dependent DNA ligase